MALPSLLFGRARRHSADLELPATLSDDARIFALTFAGGFVFMTVYLA